jgi:hypothetical protein
MPECFYVREWERNDSWDRTQIENVLLLCVFFVLRDVLLLFSILLQPFDVFVLSPYLNLLQTQSLIQSQKVPLSYVFVSFSLLDSTFIHKERTKYCIFIFQINNEYWLCGLFDSNFWLIEYGMLFSYRRTRKRRSKRNR